MKRTCFSIIGALVVATASWARIAPTGAGARPAGMQFAVTAIADDLYCTAVNPAAWAALDRKEVGWDYARLFWGLSDDSALAHGFVGYAHPFPGIGTIGASWRHFSLAGYYSENLLSAGIGRILPWHDIHAGVVLKVGFLEFGRTPYTENAVNLGTGQRLNSADPVFSAGYGTAWFTMDIGALYRLSDEHAVGLAINDLIPPDTGLATTDIRSASARIGYGLHRHLFAAGGDVVFDADGMAITAGAEKFFPVGSSDAQVGVRCGFSAGTAEFAGAALGASYRHGAILQFDYAFRYPLNGIGTFGTHQISLTLKP